MAAAGDALEGVSSSVLDGRALAWQVLMLRREQGRLADAAPIFRAFAAEPPAQPLKRAGLALLAAELGEAVEAHRLLEELSADGFAGLPLEHNWLATVALLARVCALLGDVERGLVLYDLLLPRATLNVFPLLVLTCFGSVSWYLALLATMLARAGARGPGWDEAAHHFEAAIAMHEQLGARPMLAHVARDYAEALLARGRRADTVPAQQLLYRALAIYQELGMTACAEKATELLATVHPFAPSQSPSVHPDALTEREFEVLRLLAAGASNREIAGTLVISVRTAEHHVAGIYQKIGAEGATARATATAYAFQHGVVAPPHAPAP